MRLIFLGSPAFAVPSLEKLIEAGHQVLAVVTQPDRPKGRRHELTPPPVKDAALRHGIPVLQPERIKQPENLERLANLKPEAMVVVGYGQILPQSLIDLAPHGIINVHASLLPKYRGAAPVQWVVLRGETVTGVTTMRIDAGLDTGDILLQRETSIGPDETAEELSARLAVMGAELLVETLEGLERGAIVPRKQDHDAASYAPMLGREDGLIDWNRPARAIYNMVRGLVPWPGAWTWFRERRFHIWKARLDEDPATGPPGSLCARGRRLMINCGEGSRLEALEVQWEGKKSMPAEAFINGHHPVDGEMLGEVKK